MKRNLQLWTLVTALLLIFVVGCDRIQNAPSRADAQISTDVQSKLNTDSNVSNKAIAVSSNNGIVTLTGSVGSEMERQAASNDAATVDGVKTVVNNLSVGSQSAAIPANDGTPNAAESAPNHATSTKGNRAHAAPIHTASPVSANSSASTGASNMGTNAATSTPVVTEVTVPAGTQFSIRTIDPVDSEKSQVGQAFNATLDSPVEVNGRVVIPANSDIQGRVTAVKPATKFQGSSLLSLELTKVTFNGKSYRITTDEWSKTGTARGKNTAAKVGGGAALGAIIGAIAGGGKGAAIGAGVGAGAGTGAQVLTHGEQVIVQPETLLSFALRGPVTVTPSASNRNPNRTRLGINDNR